jgi:hypothetical protein
MKKIIGFGLLCLMFCLHITLGGCDGRSEKAKMAHKAVYNAVKTLNNRNQLHYIGIVEAADKQHYKKIGLEFELFRVVSKDEARKILIDSAEELLKEINSSPQLQPYLQPSPFTIANIEISIYIRHPDGNLVYHPDLGILSLRRGIIRYSTDTPEMRHKYGFYTEEKESYEDALKIVQSQKDKP